MAPLDFAYGPQLGAMFGVTCACNIHVASLHDLHFCLQIA